MSLWEGGWSDAILNYDDSSSRLGTYLLKRFLQADALLFKHIVLAKNDEVFKFVCADLLLAQDDVLQDILTFWIAAINNYKLNNTDIQTFVSAIFKVATISKMSATLKSFVEFVIEKYLDYISISTISDALLDKLVFLTFHIDNISQASTVFDILLDKIKVKKGEDAHRDIYQRCLSIFERLLSGERSRVDTFVALSIFSKPGGLANLLFDSKNVRSAFIDKLISTPIAAESGLRFLLDLVDSGNLNASFQSTLIKKISTLIPLITEDADVGIIDLIKELTIKCLPFTDPQKFHYATLVPAKIANEGFFVFLLEHCVDKGYLFKSETLETYLTLLTRFSKDPAKRLLLLLVDRSVIRTETLDLVFETFKVKWNQEDRLQFLSDFIRRSEQIHGVCPLSIQDITKFIPDWQSLLEGLQHPNPLLYKLLLNCVVDHTSLANLPVSKKLKATLLFHRD